MSGPAFDAAVFDLDGVVTLTARLHACAWKETFDELLAGRPEQRPFDAGRDYREHVDGRAREDGVRAFLAARGLSLPLGDPADPPGRETVYGLGNRKNERFRVLLERDGVGVDAATVARIREMRERGVRLAVATSSRNAVAVLERAGLADLFEVRVDGEVRDALALPGKPRPDLFLEAVRRLGCAPERSVLVEDAAAGVEAGRRGGFGLVIGLDRGGNAIALRERGADLVVPDLSAVSLAQIEAWFEHAHERRPSALAVWSEIAAWLHGRRPAVFLDYDGTLSPIVDRPEDAVLAPGMDEALRRLARVCPVVVVSGRGREDVAGRVGLPDVVYAGSHGFDIAGPGGMRHEVDPDLRARVEEAFRELREGARGIEGAIVEDKHYSVSVHYRMAREIDVGRLEALVDRVVTADPKLRKGTGKKVFEVRPSLPWDKGRALLWILDALGLEGADVVPVYVGDDVTDEDAFAVLESRGLGILVADAPRATAARWWLQDPAEVREWLLRVARLVEAPA